MTSSEGPLFSLALGPPPTLNPPLVLTTHFLKVALATSRDSVLV